MKKFFSYARVHHYPDLLRRWRKISRAAGLKMSKIISSDGLPVYEVRSPALAQTNGIYLSAGIHGDEAAGVEGLARWAEVNLTQLSTLPLIFFPCLNPWGLIHNSRNSQSGDDLNRSWGGSGNLLTSAVQNRIRGMSFQLSLNLHEDYEGNGVYLYQLTRGRAQPAMGEIILKSAAKIIVPDSRNLIEGRKARDGIIRPRPRNILPDEMPEALFLFKQHTDQSYTLETPSEFDFQVRADAQFRMIHSALKIQWSD